MLGAATGGGGGGGGGRHAADLGPSGRSRVRPASKSWSAAAPVINAEVRGFLHKIGGRGDDPIDLSALSFSDDGRGGDRHSGDGIYTGLIPIDRLAGAAEFRVAIQAASTDSSRYIAPENPFKFDDQRRELVRRVGGRSSARADTGPQSRWPTAQQVGSTHWQGSRTGRGRAL